MGIHMIVSIVAVVNTLVTKSHDPFSPKPPTDALYLNPIKEPFKEPSNLRSPMTV